MVVDRLTGPTSRFILVRAIQKYGATLNRHPSAGSVAPPPACATSTEPGVSAATRCSGATAGTAPSAGTSSSRNPAPLTPGSSARAGHGPSPRASAITPSHACRRIVRDRLPSDPIRLIPLNASRLAITGPPSRALPGSRFADHHGRLVIAVPG